MSNKTLKTVEVSGGPQKDRTAVITEDEGGAKTYTVVSVGDFVRLTYCGESYDGIVRAIENSGLIIGWFNVHNERVLDGFSWDDIDLLVY